MRGALDDAAPLYRDAPEAQAARLSGTWALQAFLVELMPGVSGAQRDLAGDLIATTLKKVGKAFSETPRTSDQTEADADAMNDMFAAYLGSLGRAVLKPLDASLTRL